LFSGVRIELEQGVFWGGSGSGGYEGWGLMVFANTTKLSS